jgi:hypothetical protein
MVERADGDAGGAHQTRDALTLQEVAVRLGAYRWVERRLFELTGSWAAAPGLVDAARVVLFEASAQHAWHAELWEARLPVLAGVDPDRLTRPLGGAVEPLLAGLERGAFDGDEETAGRRFLVGLGRVVLPLLLVSYRRFGECLVPVSDGPALRALTLVVRDLEEELTAAQGALDALLAPPQAAQEAAEWTRALGVPVLHGAEGDDLLPWSEANSAW